MSPTLLLLGLPWLTGTGVFLSRGWQQLSWSLFVHWALCQDRIDKEVVNEAASSCQCLLLSFEGLLSEESGYEGFRHLSPCRVNQSYLLSSAELSWTVQSASTVIIQSWTQAGLNLRHGRRRTGINPETGYINITLKYNDKASLLKSIKYTMWLQYYYSEGSLMPRDGMDTFRMLQFLELAHSQVRPCAPGTKARLWVPEKFLLLYTCSTKCFGNYPGCPAPFGGNIPYIRCDLGLPD